MKIAEIKSDLASVALGDNLEQGAAIYLGEIVRRMTGKCPVWLEGGVGSGKGHLVHKVLGFFPFNNGDDSFPSKLYLDEPTDKSSRVIIGINTSDTARECILKLQREACTKEGFEREIASREVVEKHREFFRAAQYDIHVFVPYATRIRTGFYVTPHEMGLFLDYIKAVAFIDCKNRELGEGESSLIKFSYINAIEEDFVAVKDILSHVPVLSGGAGLSPEANEFAKDMFILRDKRNAETFTRNDLKRELSKKYGITMKKVWPLLNELIAAGFIVKSTGARNTFGYDFS